MMGMCTALEGTWLERSAATYDSTNSVPPIMAQ